MNNATVELRAILRDEITSGLKTINDNMLQMGRSAETAASETKDLGASTSALQNLLSTLNVTSTQSQDALRRIAAASEITAEALRGAGESTQKMPQGLKSALPTIQSVTDALGSQVAALRAQRDAMSSPDYQKYGTQMRDLQSEIKEMEGKLWGERDNVNSNSMAWANIAGKLFIAQQVYQTLAPAIMSVVHAAADYDSVRTRLAVTEGSQSMADLDLKKLQELAKLPGLGFEQAAQAASALRSMRVSANDAFSIIDGIAKANASMGGGAEQFGRVMYQLQQSIGKGKVMAEDMNAIKEAIPNLGALLEDAYGTSDSEKINKRLQETGESVRSFWMKVADMARNLPPAGDTINNNLDNISDNWKRFKANLIDSDFLKKITGNLADLSEALANTAEKSKEEADALRAENGRGGFLGVLLGDATKAEQDLAIIRGEMEQAGKAAGVGSYANTSGSQAQASYAAYQATQRQQRESDLADAKKAAEAKKEIEEKNAKKFAKENAPVEAFITENATKINAARQYQATLQDLTSQGVMMEVASIQAATDQEIAALHDRFAKEMSAKTVTAAQKATMARQEAAQEAEIQQKATEKILSIYQRADEKEAAQRSANSKKSTADYLKEVKERQDAKLAKMKTAFAEEEAEAKAAGTNEAETFWDAWTVAASDYMNKQKSMWTQMSELIMSTMSTANGAISSGFANMIVKGNSLRSTLASIGETIETSVIQEVIKIGIEWAEQMAIRETLSTAANAVTLAEGTATAAGLSAAYSGPAVAASIMSFGAADAAGTAAMAAAMAAGRGMMMAAGGGFATGSTVVGDGGRPEIINPTVPGHVTQTTNRTVNNIGGGTVVIHTGASAEAVSRVIVRSNRQQVRGLRGTSR